MALNTLVPNLVDRFLRTREVLGADPGTGPVLKRRGGIMPSNWFVDAQNGSDGSDGHDPRNPKKLLAPLIGNGASSLAQSGDTIYVVGNITEEITGWNLLEDISIIGVANRPRHADHARDIATFTTYPGVAGASWRVKAGSGNATPLLTIRGQGWHIENILFACPTTSSGIFLARNALSDVSEYDASHAEIVGCRFDAGQDGIDVTDCFDVHIKGNTFRGQTGNGIMSTGAGVAQPLMALIEWNEFNDNGTHISVAYSKSTIRNNTFGKFTTLSVDLTDGGAGGGGNNVLYLNYFFGTYSQVGGYKPAASSDEWGGNANSISGGWTAADPA